MKNNQITREDFTQVDGRWIYSYRNLLLDLAPDKDGNFALRIYVSYEPIPKATQRPTEPEWDTALRLANMHLPSYVLALEREQG